MGLQANSIAAGVGAAVRNVQFQPTAQVIPRKILVIGTYNPSLSGSVVNNVPVQVLSAEDAADRFGSGYMIHRLVDRAYIGSNGVETWVIPQAEPGGSSAATGDVDFAGSTGVQAGTVRLYIAGSDASFTIAAGTDEDGLATAMVAAIDADATLPVTAAVNGTTTSQVDITAKSDGPWGNDISIRFNILAGESLPTGVTAAVTDMSGGAGVPDIGDALNGLGTGDNANEDFFTDVVHGYGNETATLDAISAYVGAGNDFIGLYDKLVHRPFRVLQGDTGAGSGGFTAVRAIADADARKLDRASGVVSVPGSASHPAEIAAQAIGVMARTNNDRAEQSYIGLVLTGIDPGPTGDRWTSDYDNRDIAVRSGVSPTLVANGAVTLQNVVSFYHPDNVPVDSNGYRSMRNISIIQNMLFNVALNFEQEKWQGISIVEDTARVGNATSRQKARDTDSVIDDLVALARSFASRAWLYNDSFTIDRLRSGNNVTIRSGTNGFDSVFPVILSGEGGILDTVIEFDTSIAVLLNN